MSYVLFYSGAHVPSKSLDIFYSIDEYTNEKPYFKGKDKENNPDFIGVFYSLGDLIQFYKCNILPIHICEKYICSSDMDYFNQIDSEVIPELKEIWNQYKDLI